MDYEVDMATLIEVINADTGYRISPQTDLEIVRAIGKNDNPYTSGDSGVQIQPTLLDQSGELTEFGRDINDNLIDTIRIHSSGFSEDVRIWGQTISDGKFSKMFTQDATFNGANDVTLTTPLARAWKAEPLGSSDWVRGVYIYESGITFDSDGYTDDVDKIHLANKYFPGDNGYSVNSATRCSYTVPDGHMMVIRKTGISMLRSGNGQAIDGELQIREYGKSFLTKLIVTRSNAGNVYGKNHYLYAPSNSDIRMFSHVTNSSSVEIAGQITGFLVPILETS